MQASQQQQQQKAQDLRKILEQQSLEQKAFLEQMKQAELANQASGGGNGSSSWSSLFRGSQPLSPPPAVIGSTAAAAPVVSLASIQAEQVKTQDSTVSKPSTMSQKIQQQQQPPIKSQSSVNVPTASQKTSSSGGWAAWGTTNGASSGQQLNNSSGKNSNANSINLSDSGKSSAVSVGFWNEVSTETVSTNSKKQNGSNSKNNTNSQKSQNNQRHNNDQQQNNKHAKKINQIEENLQQKFLHNMTISEEFMKWCAEQLKDFHVECKRSFFFY
jgi:hypothetical protein